MASSTALGAAARALRLRRRPPLPARRPVEMRPRPLSSSVPSERHKHVQSLDTSSRGLSGEAREDIYKRLLANSDKILEALDRNTRLLKELEMQMENEKRGRVINLTPLVVLMPASFLLFQLYKYLQG
ncbi:hypothetical protein ACP4OV_002315 [Aristida adscensionis]